VQYDQVQHPEPLRVGVVGLGYWGPNLLRVLFELEQPEVTWICDLDEERLARYARRHPGARATRDVNDLLTDPDLDAVFIATPVFTHFDLAWRTLQAGKHTFVEKPLALTEAELREIESFYDDRDAPLLMTGFNRRFSPAAVHAREVLAQRTTPLVAEYRLNAGYVPLDHWVHGPEGGGRNIGEACHVYDLFDALVGDVAVESVTARAIRADGTRLAANDNFVATVAYADGSVCTLTYTALGNRDHPKERMEVFADGIVLTLDDYKSLTVTGRGSGWRAATQQKGHLEELEALARALREGGAWPISLEEQARALRIAFAVEEAIRV
jgi:predicted dehydrogenase